MESNEFTIMSHDFEITPAIRAHVRKHLEHVERLMQPGTLVHVHLSQTGLDFRAVLRANVPGRNLVSSSVDRNLYEAVIRACHMLQRQLKDQVGRRVSRRRRAAIQEVG